MSEHKTSFLNDHLSKKTSIFGLRLWVVLGTGVVAAIVILLFLLVLWFTSKRKPPSHHNNSNNNGQQPSIPNVSRVIQEISIIAHESSTSTSTSSNDNNNMSRAKVQPSPYLESLQQIYAIERQSFIVKSEEDSSMGYPRIHIEIGKGRRIVYPLEEYGTSNLEATLGAPEVSHLSWGHSYTFRELQVSTNGFSNENVIGEGGYGVVYHALLRDKTQVAVKKLLNNRGQAEREFKVEVEAIGRIRHKNLVRLLGCCAEGSHRMLVYEYVDNGNLEKWLHGEVGRCSPLTWEMRMHIILGTAKGLTYLHEGLEPKVVHRDIKSSNILLDNKWNPKVSDFGLAKLLASESSYVTTRVMGTFGYVAPEYASTGMLNERSDVYSFGVLLMEIISGRNPVDYNRPHEEVNLVDWLKKMVANKKTEGILDTKLPQKPSLRALKKLLLVALRCVDPIAHKRPRMGLVVHMLEADELPYRDDQIQRAGGATNEV